MTGRRRSPTRCRRRLLVGLWSSAALAIAPAGCAWMREHEARKIPVYGLIDAGQPRELRKVRLRPYVIEPPDDLEVEVRPSEFDLGPRLVRVQPSGVVDLGFGGDVPVAGLTLAQAEHRIAQHLTARAVAREIETDDPIEVSVRLPDQSRSKFYYVLGTVASEGAVPYEGGETVLQAILEAGLQSNSVPEKAYLARPRPGGAPDQILRIDWIGIKQRGDPTTNYQIFPGDRIIVPGTRPPGLLRTLLGG